jgi:MFS family permease
LTDHPYGLVAIQLLDGIGAGIFGVVGVLVIADLTKGTGRFNLMQGALATATGIGASLSNLMTGYVVEVTSQNTGFAVLAAIATFALLFYAVFASETLEKASIASPEQSPNLSHHQSLTTLAADCTDESCRRAVGG